MCEVGKQARVGFSPVGWFVRWGETAAEPETLPGESTAEGTGFLTASALLFVFDQKKEKWVSCEGLRKYPGSDA